MIRWKDIKDEYGTHLQINEASPDKVVLGWIHTAQYRLCGISARKCLLDETKMIMNIVP